MGISKISISEGHKKVMNWERQETLHSFYCEQQSSSTHGCWVISEMILTASMGLACLSAWKKNGSQEV